ncbi:hypothetical protein JCM10207_000181 [Rhodosporidiobolus poonsookiae]
MPSTETHRCCVCAVETENRCAACSAVGTDLFFCSKEHQKLVWKAHKRFCGKATFEHPLLEPEEAAHIKEIGFKLEFDDGKAIGTALTGCSDRSEANFAVDAVTKASSVPLSPAQTLASTVISRRLRLLDPEREAWDPVLEPLLYIAQLEFSAQRFLSGRPFSSFAWYPALMHQFLVCAAVVMAAPLAPSTVPPGIDPAIGRIVTTTFSVPTYLVLLDIIKNRIEPVDGSEIASVVRKAVDEVYRLRLEPGVLEGTASRLGMRDVL